MSFFKGPNTTTRSQKIDSFQATVCEFGRAVPVLYGTCRTSPNLINYQDFTSTEHKTTQKSGKSKSTTITYYYNCYLELAIAENIDSIGAVWVGDKKYSNIASLNAGGALTEGSPLSLNIGNNPNPTTYMSQKHPDIACGYNGLSFAYGYVFLGEDSASVPSYMFEVNGLLRNQMSNGIDANPAYVIKDILTRIGLGAYIDETSFNNYASYCYNAGLLISTPNGKFNEQKKAADIIQELCTITNAYVYWNTDRIVFIPRDDRQQADWQPNKTILYDINADDLALNDGGIIGFKRKDSSEIYNYITVNFTNRSNDYEQESVSFQDVDDIKERGIKSTTLEALWLHTKEAAIRYAKAYVRKSLTETNQYTLKLPWNYARLTAGDLIRVTDSSMNLTNQVMMVSEVQEDNHGLLTVTAIQRAAGNYSEALYSVDNDYNTQDFNIAPSDTDTPLFIIPPADLVTSANGLEIWIALRGKTNTWGGCSVYVSDKDGEYTYFDKTGVTSSYGKLVTAMSETSTSVEIQLGNTNTVELLTGSQYDAEQGNTLIWINGECMSYTNATLISRNRYRLTGLIRGQYGTTKAAHSINDDMAVLDSGIFVLPLTKHYLGRNIYFKFPAFNIFEANEQSINDLDFYTCIANTADLPNCKNIQAYNKYRELADDVTRYDIVIDWEPPDNFASYQQAQVWYKTSGTQAVTMGVIPEGTTGANMGFIGRWNYGGQGYNTVTIPQAVIGDTYKIAVCCQDIYGNVESPDMSPQVELLIALKSETPNTPANLGVRLTDAFNIYWDEVRNADIKYYEVRLDNAVGLETSNLLGRTTETKFITNAITERQGNIYVFAISAYGKVSAPAVLLYSFPKPSAPKIEVTSKLQGIECKSTPIPSNCQGIHWYFNGTDTDEDIKSSNNTYFYSAQAGVYEVNACYYDYFGDGVLYDKLGNGIMVTIEAYIPAELIRSESITLEKLSADAQKAIEEGGLDTVNIAVKGMLGEGSALVMQPSGELALVASNGQKLTGMFTNQDGVIRLQGEYIHLTGNTKVDGSIITNNMLAGGISADKINVDSLSAICATIGTLRTATSGARMELASNQLRVYDSNNRLRVRLGVW